MRASPPFFGMGGSFCAALFLNVAGRVPVFQRFRSCVILFVRRELLYSGGLKLRDNGFLGKKAEELK